MRRFKLAAHCKRRDAFVHDHLLHLLKILRFCPQGCSGGLMDYAFDFVEKIGGLDTERDYGYWGVGGSCDAVKEKRCAHLLWWFLLSVLHPKIKGPFR